MRRLGAADYRELHRISIEEPDRFWPVLVDDLGIEFSRPWDAVVDLTQGPEWATWFVGGRVNVARACLHRFAGDGEALVGLYEDGGRESLSFAEASRRVTQLAGALVGAVQVPIFSGFAAPAIAARLEDSQAKVVICADWSLRRGKRIEMRAALDEAGPHAVEHVIEWDREAREWPELVTRQPGSLPALEVDSEAPYLLAYTSGTTGRPK